jgi:outer membrane immunogenic protein
MKRLLLAGVALLTLGAASAFAADLPARMPAKAPAYLPPGYNWSGWYLGINGGYGWGRSHWTDTVAGITTGGFNLEGGLIGGTLGINWQRGAWVFGLEGDGDWSDISGSTPTACVPNCETRNNWLATFRGRVGYAFDRWLPYVTGGLAVGDIEAGLVGLGRDNSTQAGWTVGGGVEWAIAGPWTAKVEYLYTDLGTMSCSIATCGGVGTTDVDFTANILRGGINYRFGPAL